ncbi:MAG TPA: NAD(P)-binding domain-containing protein [Puia sp.]|uniref:flavin-containing monooxygenase n=1 Tax=Puia sp. TaxID=2045100 RepID=UPI002C2D10DB|nr:NAD(P)-binding domain-containing protein [Puia sp.]HVU98626.1 NAD(P)-binding domain-containing protein [Puia sp.]
MEDVQTIGIIGAGVSGLVAARTCREYGYFVKVFEKDSEPGGVWASSRRYPGVTTQNTKDTYYFSDFPMPGHFPAWPSGEQVQSYLMAYAKKFDVLPDIRLSHTVTQVDFRNNKWIVKGINKRGLFEEAVDFLIVSNGTFSDPFIPEIPGLKSFVEAGGRVYHSTEFRSTEECRDKRLIVVGFSKSASDIVTAAEATARTTNIVYREAKWKIPRFIKGINMKYLILNRLGEALVKPEQHNFMERFIHKIGLAGRMLSFMENYTTRKHGLDQMGLRPTSRIQEQAFGEINLETPGFYDKIARGKIVPWKGEIASFDGKLATLTSGETIDCDMVIFATGFRQSIPFLPDRYKEQLTDSKGNYILYRHILPAGIPKFAFVGYNTSIQCPISSEFGALWVCEYLKGRVHRPSQAEIVKAGTEFIQWRSRYRQQGSASGLSTMPGTIHHVDTLLRDMDAALPFFSLIPDWLLTIKPGRYKRVRKKIVARNGQG